MKVYALNLSDMLLMMSSGWDLIGFEETHRGSYFWALEKRASRGYITHIITGYTKYQIVDALQELIALDYVEADGFYDHYRLNQQGRLLASILEIDNFGV